MEKVCVYALLWLIGFVDEFEYISVLDETFLNHPDNEFLLSLEEYSGKDKETCARLYRYFNYESKIFDYDTFGKVLFQSLEKIYCENIFEIQVYSDKCLLLWNLLPEQIGFDEPFYTLNYAGDYLGWAGEDRTRKELEEAFLYYK